MRTKLSKILLTVALALCSIGLFTACSHEHVYTKQITEPTCLEQGYTTYTCFCGYSYIDDYVNALDHVFTNYLSDNNATYERDGTKTAHCDRTGCTATDSVTDVGSKLQSGISFNTLTVENESVFGKVSNVTETFSFIDEITTFGKMKFIVSLDIYGTQQVVSKNISLSIGDNTVYVIELLDNEPKNVYTVTVRRKPMYTVSFNTDGGTAVDNQIIEEDAFAAEPNGTPQKNGYTFDGWDYDFANPITADTTINVKWEIYMLTYDLNGGTITGLTQYGKTLSKIEIPSIIDGKTVTSIGSSAFYWCSSLTSITIPDSITSIGDSAFIGCYNLTSVNYTGTIDQWVQISFNNTISNPLWFAKNLYINNKLVTEANITTATKINNYAFSDCTSLTSVTIGNSVTSMGGYAFYNCSLTNITIPDSITSIGNRAFDCCSLTSITIPDSITSIGDNAFYCCYNLTSVYYTGTIDQWVQIDFSGYYSNPLSYAKNLYIDNKLVTEANITTATRINNYAFYTCDSLTSVTIGNSVTSIGDFAFSGCSLTNITIPDSITSIGNSTFSGCSLTSITIPDSVISIEDFAFLNCSLTSITVDKNNANYSSVDGILYDKAQTKIIYAPNAISGSITIPDGVTTIGDYAFYWCSSLTSITIPESVTSIGRYAFYGCSKLSITIPDSVTSIGYEAFPITGADRDSWIKKYATHDFEGAKATAFDSKYTTGTFKYYAWYGDNNGLLDGSYIQLIEEDGFSYYYIVDEDRNFKTRLYAKITQDCEVVSSGESDDVTGSGFGGMKSIFLTEYDEVIKQTHCYNYGTFIGLSGYSYEKSYGDYCNESDGVYPVTEELKVFLQRYSKSKRLFNDGNGNAEGRYDGNGNYEQFYSSSDSDQWLFACGYYA